MAVRLPARVDTVPAWPNQCEAARILGVSEPTLLRAKLPSEAAGAREKLYSPATVLRAVAYFKRTTLAEAAQALIDLAQEQYPTLVDEITADIEHVVSEISAGEIRDLEHDDVLAGLKEILPAKYHRQVESIYARGANQQRDGDRRSSNGATRGQRVTKGPAGKRAGPRAPALARS